MPCDWRRDANCTQRWQLRFHIFRPLRLAPWLALACWGPAPLAAQSTVRLSGYVRAAGSAEVIRYAQVLVEGGSAAQSNQDGFYILTLKAGRQVIRIRAIGYSPRVDTLDVLASQARDFMLEPVAVQLEALVVEGQRDTALIEIAPAEMSALRLDRRTIELTPVILGEADPIRTMTLLPGVKQVSDNSTGFSVRGGAPDQNLILLDESTIYNPSHVFGFFSVFNVDAIDDVKLYKGEMPPRFGGRLSSVLDVRQREGNATNYGGQVTVGTLAARALVEGPIPGVKGSFLIAARRTYADLFLKLSSDPNLRSSVANFYDLNAKANIRLGSTGAVMVSGYFGRDRYRIGNRFAANWGNSSGTVRWNQGFGSRLFSKVTLTASDYDFGLEFLGNGRDFSRVARVGNFGVQVNEQFTLGSNSTLEFGGELTRQVLHPGLVTPVGDSPIIPTELQPRYGLAPALYVGQAVQLAPSISLRYGLRWSGFRLSGPLTVYRYHDDQPLRYNFALGRYEPGIVVDSTEYKSGQSIVTFGGLEPRVAVSVGLGRGRTLAASYTRTSQFLHLISNTNTQTPVDVWEPVGPYLQPQWGDQVALGYSGTFGGGGMYELSFEGYYRWLYGVTDLIDGADITLNDRLETAMLPGQGRAYGLEVALRRRFGKLTGWLSYTLSRAERRVPGLGLGDPGLNDGKWYPAPYDKTHDLSLVGYYPLGRKWTVGATFVLSTGLPVTVPVSRYQYGGLLLVEYGPRNGGRLPLYHRLDIAFTRSSARTEWQFGLYNAYNRFNAQSLSFRQTEANPLQLELIQSSVFGIVPSVSFTYKF